MPTILGPLYCDPEDLLEKLPMDLPRVGYGDGAIVKKIRKWSRYVDEALSGVYSPPFPAYPDTPATLQIVVEMLVGYDLYIKAGVAPDEKDPRLTLWSKSHKMLDSLKSREIILDGGTEQNVTRSTPPMMAQGSGGIASLERQNRELGFPTWSRGRNFLRDLDN